MPVLNNRRWELFSQEFALNGNATHAYSKAYKCDPDASAGTSGNRLLKNVEVAGRIAELAAVRARGMSVEAEQRLSDNIRTSIGRVISLDNSRSALLKQLGELEAVIAARAATADQVHDPDKKIACNCPACVPGLATGHVAIQYKAIGSRAVKESRVDTALVREMTGIRREIRALEQQVAQELGQWETKIKMVPATVEEWFAALTPEQREAEKARLELEATRETVQ